MQLQVILQSVVAGGKKITWSTVAEEVKMINDSMMCCSHAWGVQKGVKNADF